MCVCECVCVGMLALVRMQEGNANTHRLATRSGNKGRERKQDLATRAASQLGRATRSSNKGRARKQDLATRVGIDSDGQQGQATRVELGSWASANLRCNKVMQQGSGPRQNLATRFWCFCLFLATRFWCFCLFLATRALLLVFLATRSGNRVWDIRQQGRATNFINIFNL